MTTTMNSKDMKKRLKQFWDFLGEDSLLSWVVSVGLAFVIIKYLVYPALGLILGTSFPIVAVISESMEQPGSFDEWWSVHEEFYLQKGITKNQFQNFPFSRGFNKGDIMILRGASKERLDLGDILVFQSGKPYPIIHRIVEISSNGELTFGTKGDNNPDQVVEMFLDETTIYPEQTIGKAIARIPYLGYVRVWAADFMNFILGRESIT